MIEQAIIRLNFIVEKAPGLLAQINEEKISEKSTPNKWSKKEILGHLIDSATNNHQRLIRGQFEAIPEIQYDQNQWNKYSFYQQIDSQKIISFWTIYNIQLIEIIKRIPIENFKKQVKIGQNVLTLDYVINEYIVHLEHHLKQLIDI